MFFLFFFIFSFCFVLFIIFTKIWILHHVSWGVLLSFLFVADARAHVINSPSVWRPQASSSGFQHHRDTIRNPCDCKSNTHFHSFSCYFSPFELRYRQNTIVYIFYHKKINLFFLYYFFFIFFLFFFICCSRCHMLLPPFYILHFSLVTHSSHEPTTISLSPTIRVLSLSYG